MRTAHLADLHLGFRGPGRTVNGANVREHDVYAAWDAAVDVVVEAEPDLVTIAGDVFHTVTPPAEAQRRFLAGLQRIQAVTPRPRVVIIGGNHETPKTAGVTNPNVLAQFAGPEVYVVTEPKLLRVPIRYGLAPTIAAVHCYPFQALAGERRYTATPDPAADLNVVLIHAAVRSSAAPGAVSAMYAGNTGLDVARLEGFDIVACGDFHEFRMLTPNRREFHPDSPDGAGEKWLLDQHYAVGAGSSVAFYSGSLERTSSNIWQEAAPKGVVLVDTTAGTLEFREIPTRQMLDLHTEPCMLAMDVNGYLARLLEDHRTEDALVRLRVDDFPRSERDGIDWSAVRELQRWCVHFHLDLRFARDEAAQLGDRRERRGRTILEAAQAAVEGEDPAVREVVLGYFSEPATAEVVG